LRFAVVVTCCPSSPRPAPALLFRSQPLQYCIRIRSWHFEQLSAARLACNDANLLLRNAETLGNEFHELCIGRAIDWRRGKTNLQSSIVHSRDRRLACAGLDVDFETNAHLWEL
jgi:hypothetical protein